jgi:enamine deaminase RidA (YjgF/YER057c/UK114 family)
VIADRTEISAHASMAPAQPEVSAVLPSFISGRIGLIAKRVRRGADIKAQAVMVKVAA